MPKLPKGMKGFYSYIPEEKYNELWENISVSFADGSGKIEHGAFRTAINEAVNMWVSVNNGSASYTVDTTAYSVAAQVSADEQSSSGVTVRKRKRQ